MTQIKKRQQEFLEFSPQGIPILPLNEKLEGSADCLRDESYEDAAGHLCDLLELVVRRSLPMTA